MNDKELKAYRAELAAQLEADLNQKPPDPYHARRVAFTISLIKARQRSKMTQRELADRVGVSQAAISKAETGESNPTLTTLLKVAEALGVSLVIE